ncbi:MAG: hypothetical protein K8J08_00950 [Thermoanaerobaculia bacterium]|nr:hypothetical protein [Thermoanaerobaculia bacterium]
MFLFLLLATVATLSWWVRTDPGILWLRSSPSGDWIRTSDPIELRSRPAERTLAEFRLPLDNLGPVPERLGIDVRTLGTAVLYVDGQRVGRLQRPPDRWRESMHFDLVTTGAHELRILAINRSGPAVLQVTSSSPGVGTGPHWEGRSAGSDWSPAARVQDRLANPDGEQFGTTFQATRRAAPWLLTVFLLAALAQAWYSGFNQGSLPELTPQGLRWLALGSLSALGLHNLLTIPLHIGFDVQAHYEYLAATRDGFLPAPNAGWQTFQSPFFYLIAGILGRLTSPLGSELSMRSLRLLTLAASLGQIELAYRAGRVVFPSDAGRQKLTILVVAGLGMNLYMGQYVGNEPWAGVLGAILVVRCLWLLQDPRRGAGPWEAVLLGLIAGLAILTKVSALLLLGPALAVLAVLSLRQPRPRRLRALLFTTLPFLASVGLVCSWFFQRNWLLTGKLLYTINADVEWWQDPGYRTLEQMTRFGTALKTPILASSQGFWDALYSTLWLDGSISSALFEGSPPWNYDLMLATAWLSLIPTIGLVLGILFALAPERRKILSLPFAALTLLLYAIAILLLYIRLPIYTTAKASYALALAPLIGVLAASGLGLLLRGRWIRIVTWAGVVTWALTSYLSYWALW